MPGDDDATCGRECKVYAMGCLMGNQCNSFKASVMWSDAFKSSTSLGAFCTGVAPMLKQKGQRDELQ